jgi:RNA polymerase sigma-70 factor, ECF subfamily
MASDISIRSSFEPCGLTFRELKTLSDDDVMRHLAAGHDDALTVLFDRYHRLVLKISLQIVRDPGEAQDVTQEVFLQLYRSAVRFEPAKGTSKMWILRAVYRRSLNRRQYLALRGFYVRDLREFIEEPMFPLNLMETRTIALDLLQRLKGKRRKVVELVLFEGLTMQEISDRLKDSLGNIRHHYYRGVDQLRGFISEAAAKPEAAPTGEGVLNVET